MATKGFQTDNLSPQAGKGKRIAIVRTSWNSDITKRLAHSAHSTLLDNGTLASDIAQFEVPGAFELVFASQQLVKSQQYDAIIAIGCIIRGDTPHFDYICQAVTQGITQLNTDGQTPVIFGVLTVNDITQALERTGGEAGDKGSEFAVTAIKMAEFVSRIRK